MTRVRRARRLRTSGLAAIKRKDVSIGQGLLRAAINTPPQRFEVAAQARVALAYTVVK